MKNASTCSRPRGRPRAFDRGTALECAMQIFWRQGYESTSLSDLTSAMGINPPSLYAAFGDKQRLFLETIEHYANGVGASPIRAFEAETTAREAVLRLMEDAARELTCSSHPPGCMVVVAALSCSDDSNHVQAMLAQYRRRAQARIQARIERGMREGDVPLGADAGLLARLYMTVIQGMSVQARDGATCEELVAIARAAMHAWPQEGAILKKRAKAA